jgi:hypothetical protein
MFQVCLLVSGFWLLVIGNGLQKIEFLDTTWLSSSQADPLLMVNCA